MDCYAPRRCAWPCFPTSIRTWQPSTLSSTPSARWNRSGCSGTSSGTGLIPTRSSTGCESATPVRWPGNHDAAVLGRLDRDVFNSMARAAVEWTAASASAATLAWLEALPERRVEGDFTLVHGSPREPMWEYLFSVPAARRSFGAFETPHCLVGHTHHQLVFRDDDGHIEAVSPRHGSRIVLDGRRCILNPGSVGQPRDGDPRACAMTIDTSLRHRRVVARGLRPRADAGRAPGAPSSWRPGRSARARGLSRSEDPEAGSSGTSGSSKGKDKAAPGGAVGGTPTADKQLQGRKPGDRRIRVERPQSEYFRYSAPDTLVARPKAHEEQRSLGKSLAFARRMLFGRPLATEEEIDERLSKSKALAIFSSDAISSSAYATEEILRALLLGGHRLRRAEPGPADLDRHRPAPRGRGHQLPPGVHRLSDRRRLVLRLEGELRAPRIAHRGVGAPDRLRADGRGLDLVGERAGHRGHPRPRAVPRRHRSPDGHLDHDREPPRSSGVGEHLRDPDLPVRRERDPDDRHGWVPDHRPGSGWAVSATGRPPRRPDDGRHRAHGVALVRFWRCGPDRHRSHRHGRSSVQASRGEERGGHARGHGRAADGPLRRHHVRRERVRDRSRTTSRRSSPRSQARCSGTPRPASSCS